MAAKRACLEAFEKVKETYTVLEAKSLLIQTPASFKPSKSKFKQFRRFFSVLMGAI